MLERIISIANVGRFKNCAAAGDVTFRHFTLIFAENGRGKTTLCEIFRSLLSNKPELIVGRKTLGSLGPPEIQLRTTGGNVVFHAGSWNCEYSDLAVRENRVRLQRYLPTGMETEGFAALPEDEDIEAKIAAKGQELQAVQRAAQLQQRAGLTSVAAPVFPSAFAELLARTFADMASDVEQLVGEHIARHGMEERGESWLAGGVGYFCGG